MTIKANLRFLSKLLKKKKTKKCIYILLQYLILYILYSKIKNYLNYNNSLFY